VICAAHIIGVLCPFSPYISPLLSQFCKHCLDYAYRAIVQQRKRPAFNYNFVFHFNPTLARLHMIQCDALHLTFYQHARQESEQRKIKECFIWQRLMIIWNTPWFFAAQTLVAHADKMLSEARRTGSYATEQAWGWNEIQNYNWKLGVFSVVQLHGMHSPNSVYKTVTIMERCTVKTDTIHQ
jgi:hypothetical protein